MIFEKIKTFKGAAADSIVLTFVRVITTILGLLVTKLLSTQLTLEEYGTYSQAMLIVSTATSISILGLTNAVNYFYNASDNKEEKQKYVSTMFSIQYLVGTITAILIVVCHSFIIHYFKNDQLDKIIYLIAWMPLLENVLPMLQVLFVSIGRAKLIAIRNFIISVLRLLVVVITCYVTKNILTIFVILLLLDLIQVVYFMYAFSKTNFKIKLCYFTGKYVMPIMRFSIPMAIYIMCNSFTRDIDKYVISFFTDTTTLAIYTNASKILPFDMITASFITVLIPIITRQVSNKEYYKAKYTMKTYLRLGYILTWIAVFGAVIVAKELMIFLYSEKYLSGLSVFIVYLLVDMVRFANTSMLLVATGKTNLLMISTLVSLVLNFVLNIISFKMLGIFGPAISTLIITIGLTFYLLSKGAKQINCFLNEFFDFKEVLLIFAELLVIGLLCYLLKINIANYTNSNVFILAFTYLLFVGMMFLINKNRIIQCLKEVNKLK